MKLRQFHGNQKVKNSFFNIIHVTDFFTKGTIRTLGIKIQCDIYKLMISD